MTRCIFFLIFFSCMFIAHKGCSEPHIPSPGSITIALENSPISIIPMLYTGSLSGQISAQVFSSVCRLDDQGNPVPYLAKSYEYSNNYKEITIHLQENATFHDGTPISAKDVAFSIHVAQQIHPYHTVFEQLQNINVLTQFSLRLSFNSPQPHFMKILIPALLPVLPQHIYKTVEGVQNSSLTTTFVGSGPFQPVSYARNTIILKKYPGFFIKGKPHLNGITYRTYTDIGENFYSIVEGETDISAFRWRYAQEHFAQENPDIRTINSGYNTVGAYILLQFNLLKEPFNNPSVRKALSLAIDRKFLADKGFHRTASPMFGPLLKENMFYSDPEYDYEYSIEKANSLLDEAGFPRNEVGVRMQIETEAAPYIGQLSAVLEYLQYEFARTIGVELVIRNQEDFETWGKNIAQGNYSSTIDELFSWHDPLIGIHRLYASTNRDRGMVWSNTSGYHNPEVDKLFFHASSEPDPLARKKIYKQLQEIIGSDYAAIWLTSAPYTTVYNKRVFGLEKLPLGTMSPMDEIYTTDSATDYTRNDSQ